MRFDKLAAETRTGVWIETVLRAARLQRANVLMLDALRYA
jgi:hypothetical protein